MKPSECPTGRAHMCGCQMECRHSIDMKMIMVAPGKTETKGPEELPGDLIMLRPEGRKPYDDSFT